MREHAVNVSRSLGISQDVPHLLYFVSERAPGGTLFIMEKKHIELGTSVSPVIPDEFSQLGCRTSKQKVCLDGKDNYGFAIFGLLT